MIATTLTDRRSVKQLARREGVHCATVWRWIETGVRGLRLKSLRVGARRFVTDADWQAFSDALNADLIEVPTDPAPAATARAERAGRELEVLIAGSRRGRSPTCGSARG